MPKARIGECIPSPAAVRVEPTDGAMQRQCVGPRAAESGSVRDTKRTRRAAMQGMIPTYDCSRKGTHGTMGKERSSILHAVFLHFPRTCLSLGCASQAHPPRGVSPALWVRPCQGLPDQRTGSGHRPALPDVRGRRRTGVPGGREGLSPREIAMIYSGLCLFPFDIRLPFWESRSSSVLTQVRCVSPQQPKLRFVTSATTGEDVARPPEASDA